MPRVSIGTVEAQAGIRLAMTISGKLQLFFLDLGPVVTLIHAIVTFVTFAFDFLCLFRGPIDDGRDEQRQICDGCDK